MHWPPLVVCLWFVGCLLGLVGFCFVSFLVVAFVAASASGFLIPSNTDVLDDRQCLTARSAVLKKTSS